MSEIVGDGGGKVVALEARDEGTLVELCRADSGGDYPCHIVLEPENRGILVSNYGSGTVSRIPLDSSGRFSTPPHAVVQHRGSGPRVDRQERAHAHCVALLPGEMNRAFAVDLGCDRVFGYQLAEDHGELVLNPKPAYVGLPGAGPRHLVFSPDGKFGYMVNELNSTVSVLAVGESPDDFSHVMSVTTLPRGWSGVSTAAEVRLHPNGSWLFASNRGHDSIAVFRVDKSAGRVEPAGHAPSGGLNPRHFALHPDGKRMLVANQKDGAVSALRFDPQTGALEIAAEPLRISRASCVCIAPVQRPVVG